MAISRYFQPSTLAVFLLVSSAVSLEVFARGVPLKPHLMVESGMHSASFAVSVDPQEQFFVTASRDKTIRVWALSNGLLLNTIRPPIGAGNEGRFYDLALSPDGNLIAAGGATGWEWDRKISIYVFDRATGDMVHRLSGLPNIVRELTWSANGQFLAVSFPSGHGIRVFDSTSWEEVFRDDSYEGNVPWVEFGPTGRLVTSSESGHLSLYNTDFELIKKIRTTSGDKPHSARFSPDGTLVAVGFEDTTAVEIRSGSDLAFVHTPATRGIKGLGLAQTAWSPDGQTLYAGGMFDDGSGMNPVFRWSEAGRGSLDVVPALQNSVMELEGMSGDRVLVAAADPAFAVLGRNGEMLMSRQSTLGDFHGNQQSLRVSEDGNVVRFSFLEPQERGGSLLRFAQFSVNNLALTLDPPPLADESLLLELESMLRKAPKDPNSSQQIVERASNLLAEHFAVHGASALRGKILPVDTDLLTSPITQTPDISISGWVYDDNPSVNGEPIRLNDGEQSRRIAIAPDQSGFAVGTEWSLRYFDKSGRSVWNTATKSTIWDVNITPDNKHVVAIFADGSIKWYRLGHGEEVLSLLVNWNATRWVLYTPDGFYHGSGDGETMLGYHINRGIARTSDFVTVKQLAHAFHRPDLVSKRLGGSEELYQEVLEQSGFAEELMVRAVKPKMSLVWPEAAQLTLEEFASLTGLDELPEELEVLPEQLARLQRDGTIVVKLNKSAIDLKFEVEGTGNVRIKYSVDWAEGEEQSIEIDGREFIQRTIVLPERRASFINISATNTDYGWRGNRLRIIAFMDWVDEQAPALQNR